MFRVIALLRNERWVELFTFRPHKKLRSSSPTELDRRAIIYIRLKVLSFNVLISKSQVWNKKVINNEKLIVKNTTNLAKIPRC